MSEPSCEEIEDREELLYRQVYPQYVDDERPSSQVFCPMPKDEGRLSVSAGSIVDAATSYQRFIERGFRSAGVLAVNVGECKNLSLPALYDPLTDDEEGGPDDAHAQIDMHDLSGSRQKKCAKKLAKTARERGWSFRPDNGHT